MKYKCSIDYDKTPSGEEKCCDMWFDTELDLWRHMRDYHGMFIKSLWKNPNKYLDQ